MENLISWHLCLTQRCRLFAVIFTSHPWRIIFAFTFASVNICVPLSVCVCVFVFAKVGYQIYINVSCVFYFVSVCACVLFFKTGYQWICAFVYAKAEYQTYIDVSCVSCESLPKWSSRLVSCVFVFICGRLFQSRLSAYVCLCVCQSGVSDGSEAASFCHRLSHPWPLGNQKSISGTAIAAIGPISDGRSCHFKTRRVNALYDLYLCSL